MTGTKQQLILLLSAVLCLAQHYPSYQSCFLGPGRCFFQTLGTPPLYTWCKWTSGDDWTIYYVKAFPSDYMAGLKKGTFSGRLESRKACSTQGFASCLSFQYSFDVNDMINLSVYMVNANNRSDETKLWSTSTSSTGPQRWMDTAKVPITTNFDYHIVFEAARRTGTRDEISVYVDDVNFHRKSCRLFPANAAVVTTTAAPATSAVASANKIVQTTTTYFELQTSERNENQTQSSSHTTKARIDRKITNPEESSTNIGVIIGSVIGAIFLAIICISLYVICRKRTGFICAKDKCRRKENPEDVSRPTSEIYYSDIVDYQNTSQAASPREGEDVRNHTASASAHPSDEYYSVIGTHDEENVTHVEASPPGKNQIRGKISARGKKVLTNGEASPHKQDSIGGNPVSAQYASVNKAHQNTGVFSLGVENEYTDYTSVKDFNPEDNAASSNVYHILESSGDVSFQHGQCPNSRQANPAGLNSNFVSQNQGARDLYNVLSFDSTGRNVQKPTVGETGCESGAVYSHLREGDEDAYNEVDRERRTDVIGDEYSHIQ